MDETGMEHTTPLTEPLSGPSVSAWTRSPQGTPEPYPEASELRPWFRNLYVLVPLLCLVVFFGYAVVAFWITISQDIRHERQVEALDVKYAKEIKDIQSRLGKGLEERLELQRRVDTMRNEQEWRKIQVESFPDLTTRLRALEIQLSVLLPQVKTTETQVATNRENLATLKREVGLLTERYRDLAYVHQPRIPLPPGGQP